MIVEKKALCQGLVFQEEWSERFYRKKKIIICPFGPLAANASPATWAGGRFSHVEAAAQLGKVVQCQVFTVAR